MNVRKEIVAHGRMPRLWGRQRVPVLAAILAAVAGSLAFGSDAHAASDLPTGTPPAVQPQVADEPARALTEADLNDWLDGYVQSALAMNSIAGAAVVIVKDGQVLLEKGYGYADVGARKPVVPQRTLFRYASISKLFTWTAVMQLVDQHKLDLDADINTYLDFTVRALGPRPITLRNLMTHTAGFQEVGKDSFGAAPGRPPDLERFVKEHVPARIFRPGERIAYSNYGAALAGYIVQRVSGQPFAQYIERNIFQPLHMTRSTFREPLPPELAASMSNGYALASEPPRPFEMVPQPPGGLTSTPDDMGKFMIAHLQDGRFEDARILSESAARLMHAPSYDPGGGVAPMGLGFFEEDQPGVRMIGHDGDSQYFHSDLHLLLNQHVGYLLVINSQGQDGGASRLRTALFQAFLDRYYPVPADNRRTAATARAHVQMLSGSWLSSRRAELSWIKLLNLFGQAHARANTDGTLEFSPIRNSSGVPVRWREVAPFQFVDQSGRGRLLATRDGEGNWTITSNLYTGAVFVRPPGSERALPIVSAVGLSLALFLVTLVGWPVRALIQRAYQLARPVSKVDRWLHRSALLVSAANLTFIVGWLVFMARAIADLRLLSRASDPFLHVLQVAGALGALGIVVLAWRTVRLWRQTDTGWSARIGSLLLLLAGLMIVWFGAAFHLYDPTLAY